jgi:hypothetical protein
MKNYQDQLQLEGKKVRKKWYNVIVRENQDFLERNMLIE